MRCLLFLVVTLGLLRTVVAQDEDAPQFYEVDIAEIAIADDVELPSKLAESLDQIDKLVETGKVLLKESLRFSAMANRPTRAGFGSSVNVLAGIVERGGIRKNTFAQQQTGTQVNITIVPANAQMVSAKISYQAMRVAGEIKEDEMTNFAQTQLTMDTQLKLREPTVLIARAEGEKRFIILTVRRR